MLKNFALIAASFVVVPAIIGVLNYRVQGRDLRALSLFLILSTLTEITAITFFFLGKNNFPLLHVFTLFEFALLTYLYSEHIHSFIPRKVILTLVIAFTVFSLANSLFIQSVYTFNSYARGIEFLILLFYAIVHMYWLSIQEAGDWKKMPMFWINMGMLLYYSSSFFVVIMVNLVMPHMQSVWAVHNVFLILHYLFFCKALWITPKH